MPKSENSLDNIKIETNNIFAKSRYENVLNEEKDTKTNCYNGCECKRAIETKKV